VEGVVGVVRIVLESNEIRRVRNHSGANEEGVDAFEHVVGTEVDWEAVDFPHNELRCLFVVKFWMLLLRRLVHGSEHFLNEIEEFWKLRRVIFFLFFFHAALTFERVANGTGCINKNLGNTFLQEEKNVSYN